VSKLLPALILGLLCWCHPRTCAASTVTFTFTNSVGLPDLHPIQILPLSPPVLHTNWTFISRLSLTLKPNASGTSQTNLMEGCYQATNPFIGQGIEFCVPNDTNTYAVGQLATNGFTVFTYTPLVTQVTNADGSMTVSPASGRGVVTVSVAAPFNTTNRLVKLDGSNRLPAVDGSQLTGIVANTTNNVAFSKITAGVNTNGSLVVSNGASLSAAGTGSIVATSLTDASAISGGTLSDARLNADVTKQGNIFNGVSELVQLDGAGKLPAIDGSQLTGLSSGLITSVNANQFAVGSGNLSLISGALATNLVASWPFSGYSYKLFANSGAGQVEFDYYVAGVYTSSPWVASFDGHLYLNNVIALSGEYHGDGLALVNLAAGNIGSGTLADARLSANVTLQGNTFNGASQLLQATAATKYPALDGSLITLLNAGALSSGTVPTARLGSGSASSSTVLLGSQAWGTVPNAGLSFSSFTLNGTANQVIVTGGGPLSLGGTATLSLPQDIAISSSPGFANILASGTAKLNAIILTNEQCIIQTAWANGPTGAYDASVPLQTYSISAASAISSVSGARTSTFGNYSEFNVTNGTAGDLTVYWTASGITTPDGARSYVATNHQAITFRVETSSQGIWVHKVNHF
jgi:hypothetical protein